MNLSRNSSACRLKGLCVVYLLYFILVLRLDSTSEFTKSFGGVLSQRVINVSQTDPDVAEAVQLASRRAKFSKLAYSVSNIEKERLYYTADGISPFVLTRHTRNAKGRTAVQRSQLVLGLLYTFSVRVNKSTVCDHKVEYRFTVTRDRNKEYHVIKWMEVVPRCLLRAGSEAGGFGTCRDSKAALLGSFLQSSRFCVAAANFGSSSSNSSSNTDNSDEFQLRVASYNVWNTNRLQRRGESYKKRAKRMMKFISSLDVDVLGLQEVRLEVPIAVHDAERPRSKRKRSALSQISQIASSLPEYHFVYQPAMLYTEEMVEEGLAIFSRYPILSSDYRLLFKNDSDGEDSHQRICLHAELHTPQMGLVHVFVSHLSLSQSAQARSVVEIWHYMQSFSGIKLLMGDLNAEPNSKPMRFLSGEVSLEGVWTSGLHDTWDHVRAGSEHDSQSEGFTFSALEEELVKRVRGRVYYLYHFYAV